MEKSLINLKLNNFFKVDKKVDEILKTIDINKKDIMEVKKVINGLIIKTDTDNFLIIKVDIKSLENNYKKFLEERNIKIKEITFLNQEEYQIISYK